MRKICMKILYALLLIHCSKVRSTQTPLATVASEQVTKMKDLIKFMREEAASEKRDIEEGVLHIGIADVKETLMAKVEELHATKPQCVKDTEAVANGIVSEVGNYVKKCFALIEEKLESASNLADNAKTTSDVDKLVTTVSDYHNNKQSHFDKCTKPAAKVMLARMQKEEENIENCVSGVTTPEGIKPEVTKPEVTKPEVTKPEVTKPESEPKLPSTTIKIYYILQSPKPCTCGPRRPRRRKVRPAYYYYRW